MDAALAAAAWLLPAQLVTLAAVGTPFVPVVVLSVACSLALMLPTPFLSGLLQAANVRRADGVAWLTVLTVAALVLNTFAGWIPAVVEIGVGAVAFGHYLRGGVAAKKAAAAVPGLPEPLVQRVLALPKQLEGSLRQRLDQALAAHGSLVKLIGPEGGTPPEIDAVGMLEDAVACVREVVERTEAADRLGSVASRTPKVEAAAASLLRQITTLVESLTAAVDAAATYTAVGQADAASELAERAEYLHDVAQSRVELDRELAE